MNLLKGSFTAHAINALGLCIITILITASGAVATEATFDVEAVKAKYSIRDYVYQPLPERGYNYFKIAENAYFVHDDFENMVFFVTEEGVVVYDAKPDVTPFLLKVIPQVTDKPITHVIYSHHHRDHAEGMHLFPESATIIANSETAQFLKWANDPKRPLPDIVWEDSYVLETGGLRLEFKDLERNWHSQTDSIMYAPQQKLLFAIDMFHPDAAPWIHWGESTDPMFAFMLPEKLLNSYDFEFVITGHERIVGTRAHMKTYKELIEDMKKSISEIAQSKTFHDGYKETMARYSDGAEHWIYKEFIMSASNACADQFIENWTGRVRNVRLNAVENCQTMFMHVVILDP